MYYSSSHLWISIQKANATVGIAPIALREIGQVVFVDLPSVGEEIVKGQLLCLLESSKAALEILSPLSGRILEVNPRLAKDPELLNRSCQEEGWLVKMTVGDISDLQDLLDEETYTATIGNDEKN